MEVTSLILQKAVIEVRFHAIINYPELRLDLFRKWTDKFSNIEIGENIITLSNAEEQFGIFSEWHRAGSSIEGPVNNFARFRDVTCNFLDDLMKKYGVTKLTRIGVRFFYVIPYTSFQELANILNRNIFTPHFAALFPDARDVGAAFVCKHGQNEYWFSTGPVTRDELATRAGLKFSKQVAPENGLFIDIDYRRTELMEHNIRTFTTEAHRFAAERARQYVSFVEV